MKKATASIPGLLLLAIPFLFSRCSYHAFYQSPFHANVPYHVIPMQSDSIRSATYASGIFTEGGANNNLRDNVFSFTGSLYRSHNFGPVQAFYGADLAVGSYKVKDYIGKRYPSGGTGTTQSIPDPGNKFFGGYGGGGGINVVQALSRRCEWRIIGVSFNLYNEFGDYRQFRKKLPDSLADVIFNNTLTGMLGLSTEWAFKTHHGMIAYKLMVAGDVLNGNEHYRGYDSTGFGMIFVQNTISFTHDRVTGYVQLNAGNHAANVQLGVGYRLGRLGRN